MSINKETLAKSQIAIKTLGHSEPYKTYQSSLNSIKFAKHTENNAPNSSCPVTGTAQTQFNKKRKIIIRNIPPVTYEEVKTFMNGYGVDNISISKKSRHAIVTLVHGEKAEEVCETLIDKQLLNTDVTVSVHPNENLLCVAHLPFNLEDKDFLDIVSEFGGVERCFLLRSDSGKSKGYGFVEWQHNKEKSSQARQMIDNKKLGSCTLHCEFLGPTILSFEDLHSKCIQVDHLPTNYGNATELMNILSRIQTPKFFRLGTRSEGQGFAIVGYELASDAEVTQQEVNGYVLNGYTIRVTYCIPGQQPEDIFERLKMNTIPGNKGNGLLPPPPSLLDPIPNPALRVNQAPKDLKGLMNGPDITSPAMQNLLAQSPQALQTFQDILLQLQQQNTNRVHGAKPGLLGMAPHMPHNNVLLNPNMQVALLAVILASQIQQAQPAILSNPILQQMMANSMQQQSSASRPSLLGNPMIAQANMMLQTSNLMKLLSTSTLDEQNLNINVIANFSQLVNTLQGMGSSFPDQQLGNDTNNSIPCANNDTDRGNKGLLGDTPYGPVSSGLLGNGPHRNPSKGQASAGPANPLLALFLEQQIRQQLSFQQTQNQISELVSNNLKRRHVSVNNNTNPQAFNNNRSSNNTGSGGLLPIPGMNNQQPYPLLPNPEGAAGAVRSLFGGTSTTGGGLLPTPVVSKEDAVERNGRIDTIPPLMRSFVPTSSSTKPITGRDELNSPAKKFPKIDGHGSKGLLGDMPESIKQSILGYSAVSSTSDSSNKENLGFDPSTGFWANQSNYGYGDSGEQWQSDYSKYYSQYYDEQQNGVQPKSCTNRTISKPVQPSSNNSPQEGWYQQASEYSQYYQGYFQQYAQQAEQQPTYGSPPTVEEPANLFSSDENKRSAADSQSYMVKTVSAPRQNLPAVIQPLPPGTEPSQSLLGPPPAVTPIGSGRKAHLVPSPEPSPDGHYVGQHSQGLGGHYADSYVKKGALDF